MQSTISIALLLLTVSGCESNASASSAPGAAPAVDAAPATSTLNVSVEGLRNSEGGLVAFLYDSENAFPRDFDQAARTKRRRSLEGTSAAFRFTGLTPGTYALLVVHDENGNGELDRNLVGFPQEGVGASNVKKGRPKWSTAKFIIDEHRNVTVSMQYF